MSISTAIWQARQLVVSAPSQWPVTFGPDNIIDQQGGAAAAATAAGITGNVGDITDSVLVVDELVNGQVTFSISSALAGVGGENGTIRVGTTAGGQDLYAQENSPNRVGNPPAQGLSFTVPLSRTVMPGETIYVERRTGGGAALTDFTAVIEEA